MSVQLMQQSVVNAILDTLLIQLINVLLVTLLLVQNVQALSV